MRRVTAALLCAAAIGQFGLAAASPALAQPRASTDIRAQRRATAESIAAQYAAEQFRAARIGDENTRKLLAENDAQRRKIAAVLKDAKATAAQRDAARAQLAALDAQLVEVNKKLLASEQTGDELRAQLREYQRQISDAVESASPEVAAAYELYAQGDRDTAYEVIDRLSQVEAAAAKRAGEIRAGALLRRPATLAYDRRDRGEMTLAQVIVAWERAQAADPTFHEGWVDLTSLYIEAGRLADARKAAEQGMASSSTDTERGRAGGLLGEVLLAMGDTRGATATWDTALKRLRAAYAADATNEAASRGVLAVLDRIGDLRTQEQEYGLAAAAYREELELCRRRVAASPADALRPRRDLVVCLSKVGDANLNLRDFAAAKGNYEEMLALTRTILARDPSNLYDQRSNGMALVKMGEFLTKASQWPQARPYLDEALAIMRRLAALDPTSAIARRDLSVAIEYRARAQETVNAAGLKAYRELMDESLQIRREMIAADPHNVQIQRDLCFGLDAYADRHTYYARSNQAPAELVHARKALDEALAVYRRIAAAETANGYDQRNVGLALGDLAYVIEASGDPAAAKPVWEEMLALRRKLVEQNDRSARVLRDLGGGLSDMGLMRSAAKDWQGAATLHSEAVTNFRKALALDPTDLHVKQELGLALKSWGDAAFALHDGETVKKTYVEAASLLYEVLAARPEDPAAHREFWGTLYMWASMTDNVDAWKEAIKYMEAADAKGFLSAADRSYLTDSRKALKAAEAKAARTAATPGGSR